MLDSLNYQDIHNPGKNRNPKHPLVSETRANTIIRVKDVEIGGDEAVIMAGPCSVESREQVLRTAKSVKKSGAVMIRGGAYKPRTSPYDFQGLGIEGLKILREAGDLYNLPVVTEIMSEEDVGVVSDHADMLQVGARNMQNFALLKRLAKGQETGPAKKKPIGNHYGVSFGS